MQNFAAICRLLQADIGKFVSDFGNSAVGNNDMMIGAKRIAAALKGPVGQIKLARIVGQHIRWFEDARSQGMTWDQIVVALTAAGAARADQTPFTRGSVSSAVWRATNRISRKKATGRESTSPTATESAKRSRDRASSQESRRRNPDRNESAKEEKRGPALGAQTNARKAELMRLMKRAGKIRANADDEGG